MVYMYNGILFNLKKEGTSASCDNMDEPGVHYAKWNKVSLYVESLKQKKKSSQSVEWWLPEAVGRGRMEILIKG